MLRDLLHAVSRFRRRPLSSFIAIATFSIGVAVSSALLNAFDLLIFRPLPVKEPDELVYVNPGRIDAQLDSETYLAVSEARSFEGVTASHVFRARASVDDVHEVLFGEFVAENYFELLGVRPAMGFLPSGAEPSLLDHGVVISNSFWKERFAGSVEAVGRPIRIRDELYIVVGVAPPLFRGVADPKGTRVEIWIPTKRRFQSSLDVAAERRTWRVITRLRSGASIDQATAEVRTIGDRVLATRSGGRPTSGFTLRRVTDVLVSPGLHRQIRILFFAAAIVAISVLAISAINLAHLFLLSTVSRRLELATMAALGAPIPRLLRFLLTEYLLLALIAASLGTLGAYWLLRVALASTPQIATYSRLGFEVHLDARFWAVGVGSAILVSIPAAVIPIIGCIRGESELLRYSRKSKSAPFGLRNLAIVPQLALSVALLALGNAMAQRMSELNEQQPTFYHDGRVVIGIDWSLQTHPPAERRRFLERLGSVISRQYGNSNWTLCSSLPIPLPYTRVSSPGFFVDRPVTREFPDFLSRTTAIGPNYFRLLGVPILSGREFAPEDSESSPRVGMVSKSTAERFWPGKNAIGERVFVAAPGDPGPWRRTASQRAAVTVVGVVPDLVVTAGDPEVYVAFKQNPVSRVFLVVRTPADPPRALAELRDLVRQLDHTIAVTEASTLSDVARERTYFPGLVTSLLRVLGLVALTLSWMGLYAVMSFLLLDRTREFGIRISLGATPGTLRRLVVRESLAVIVPGAILGGFAAYWLVGASSLIAAASQLRAADGPVRPVAMDWTELAAQVAVLSTACLWAALIAARRTATIDPMQALRAE